MQEPAGEFGEIVRGVEGTVVEDLGDTVIVEWDNGVMVAAEAWMVNAI